MRYEFSSWSPKNVICHFSCSLQHYTLGWTVGQENTAVWCDVSVWGVWSDCVHQCKLRHLCEMDSFPDCFFLSVCNDIFIYVQMIPPRGCAYIVMVHRQDAYTALKRLSRGSYKVHQKPVKVHFLAQSIYWNV